MIDARIVPVVRAPVTSFSAGQLEWSSAPRGESRSHTAETQLKRCEGDSLVPSGPITNFVVSRRYLAEPVGSAERAVCSRFSPRRTALHDAPAPSAQSPPEWVVRHFRRIGRAGRRIRRAARERRVSSSFRRVSDRRARLVFRLQMRRGTTVALSLHRRASRARRFARETCPQRCERAPVTTRLPSTKRDR